MIPGGGEHASPAADSFALGGRVRLNVALKLASEVAGKVLALGMTAALARGLGTGGFGVYVFGFTAGLMLSQICDFGMQLFAAREVARGRRDAPRLVGNLLVARAGLGVLGLGGTVAGAGLAGFSGEGWLAVSLLAGSVVVASFGEFAFYVFRGRQEVRFEAGLSVVHRFLGLAAVLLVLGAGGGIGAVAGALLGVAGISLAAAYGVLTHRFFRPEFTVDTALLREAFREILPIGLAITLSAVCFRVDVVILKALGGIESVGLYGAGRRLMEPLALLPAALMAGVFPAFSALPPGDALRPSMIWKTSLVLLAVSLPLATLATPFREPILVSVYGKGYAAAGTPFILLMATLIPMFLTYGFTHFLIAMGLARLNAVFFGAGLIVNLAANLILVPHMGALGCALALLITESLLMVLCGGALLKIARP